MERKKDKMRIFPCASLNTCAYFAAIPNEGGFNDTEFLKHYPYLTCSRSVWCDKMRIKMRFFKFVCRLQKIIFDYMYLFFGLLTSCYLDVK